MYKLTKLSMMLHLATNKHDGVYDRGGMPYILHPIAVMEMLNTKDEELKCIAVGHDLIEDTDVTADFLAKLGFSPRVVRGIVDLSKVAGEDSSAYKARVMSNVDAMRVKICDLRHNSDIRRLKGVSEKDIARMEKYHRFYIDLTVALSSIGES
jgi:(p)ppGpp synthase/HD superfamily hydrolase